MKQQVEYQSFFQALKHTNTITAGSIAAYVLFTIIIYGETESVSILYWFGFMVVHQLLRQLYAHSLIKKHEGLQKFGEIEKDRFRYAVLVFVSALGWAGLELFYIMGGSSDTVLMFLIIFMIGMMAGSIFSLSMVPLYFSIFNITLALPAIFSFLVVGDYAAALVILIFFLFALKSSRDERASILKTLELNLSNAGLIRDLKEANKLKGEFLANMSHEIRTPMNAILGFIQILMNEEYDKEKLQYLKTISNSGKDLLQIIDDILDFSKIENNQLMIEQVIFNPKERINQSIELYKSQSDSKQIQVITEFGHNFPKLINSDPTRLAQIVNNLLSNAIKFSPENTKIWLRADYDFKQNQLNVSIQDQGIGLSAQKQKEIFEPFTQADSSTTRKYGGTGLGLAICKGFVEKLGGEISVQSELGKGCLFSFNINAPRVEIKTEAEKQKTITDDTALSGHVLIVEDNKTNQLLVSKLLERLGLTYEIANDGDEGVQFYKENKYDLILMDENMPNMNGIEATAEIRAMEESADKHIPIIALTANSIKGDRERFIEAGMDEYLSKPIDVQLLNSTLRHFLNR